MFKVRISGRADVAFDDRDTAFEWIRNNAPGRTMFSLLTYNESGSLESMDRFTFTGSRFLMENIIK